MLAPTSISYNLQHLLWDRESVWNRFNRRTCPVALDYERNLLRNLTPNCTIQNVDKGSIVLRKFSPDGKHLIGYSRDLRALIIMRYIGVTKTVQLLQCQSDECFPASNDSEDADIIRSLAFRHLFAEPRCLSLAPKHLMHIECYKLHPSFSIFFGNGQYVLVAGYAPMRQSSRLSNYNSNNHLMEYYFYLVSVADSRLLDVLDYRFCDIALFENNGVAVHGDLMAVLLKHNQNIDLIRIVHGSFVRMHSIGLQQSSIWHCVLTSMRDKIFTLQTEHEEAQHLQQLHDKWSANKPMLLNKIQFINEQHLLLRFTSGGALRKIPNEGTMLFAVYSIEQHSVVDVLDGNSTMLLFIQRNFSDILRNTFSYLTQRSPSSPSNNIQLRQLFDNGILSVSECQSIAVPYYNLMLPISAQSFSTSSYLDFGVFKYDERLISPLERPRKICPTEPIAFTDRATDRVKYNIMLDTRPYENFSYGINDSVSFIYHPFEPLIITVQRIENREITNIHFYNSSTIVK